MKTDAEYAAKRRERFRAEGRCIDCGAGLVELDDWSKVRCPECDERHRAASLRYQASPHGRAKTREYQRARYARNRSAIRAQVTERVERRKLAGQCLNCQADATDDSPFCAAHLVGYRAATRESMARRRVRLIAQGLCIRCGREPAAENRRSCPACLAKDAARARKAAAARRAS